MQPTRQVAMVTGAARGIGAAIADALAADGADVAVCDLDMTAATATAEALVHKHGHRSIAVHVDVADGTSVRAAVATIEQQLGPIEILVNNAGIDKIEPFVDSTEATWDRLLAVNLKGPINTCHAVVTGMIARGSGKIVNIGSDAGRVGSSGEAVYSATKGGVIAFSKTLAR
jgi:2-hydroxycyclohexanecarboxyl-CoA dehydrogenase